MSYTIELSGHVNLSGNYKADVKRPISKEDAARQQATAREILDRFRTQPGVILADEVGMGKTFVALAVAAAVALPDPDLRPVVVMVPPSLREKWPNDFDVFREKCLSADVRAHLEAGRAEKAVDFLKNLDGPAYMHCYLGKHRVIHVRDELAKAGVPKRYWTPAASGEEYWNLVNRINDAQAEFAQKNYDKVLEILAPLTTKDVDVTSLRGWAHYRLGLIDEAMEDFRQGLEADPSNPRNLIGVGYCYLRSGQPVMAQRQFSAVLEQIPNDRDLWWGWD
jgi:hypothetical protein